MGKILIRVIALSLMCYSSASWAQDIPQSGGVSFVSSCRFHSGQKAFLIIPMGGHRVFVNIRSKSGENDISSISPEDMSIETNGGIDKIDFISRIFSELLNGPFKVINGRDFSEFLKNEPKVACGMPFNLSPK